MAGIFDLTKLPHVRSADFVSTYTNAAHILIGFYDLGIVFSQVSPLPDGSPVFQEKVSVTMSLEHAKALTEALRATIENYEKENGPIRSRPDSTINVGVVANPDPE
jgi:hypothetical protein